jgi:CPA1 family monovalent cation:H+ antiporter
MQATLQTVLLLLIAAAAVGLLAKRLRVPDVIALVLAGVGLAAAGGFPAISLEPEVVLQVFLPILLFEAALAADVGRLRRDLVPVVTLAAPGLLVSVGVAGLLLHLGLGLPLPVALLLGAMLAATDTIAVIASFRRVRAPQRLATLVESESLFNDGTALVAFTTLLAVVLEGRFDPTRGLWTLAWVTLAGLAVGAAVGFAGSTLMHRTEDHLMEIMLTVIVTFGSALAGEALHASAVLAVVAGGIAVGHWGWPGISATGKVAIRSVWEVAAFGVNAVVFLLIGLQVNLGRLLQALPEIGWGLLALTAGRAASIYLPLLLLRPAGWRVPLTWQHLLVWGNLKGSLSMALALSLPAALPERDRLVAVVFGCALVTLTVQGLTLTPLLRLMGVGGAGQAEREIQVRQGELLAARAGQAELERMQKLGLLPLGVFRLRASYQGVVARSERAIRELLILNSGEEARHDRTVRRRLLVVEKAALREAVDSGLLGADVGEELLQRADAALAELPAGEED